MSTRKSINGEMLTLEEAYNKHKGLIFRQSLKFRERGSKLGYDLEDLDGIGAIGFIKAYNDFDESKGYRFSTYAVPKIFGAIIHEINRNSGFFKYAVAVKDWAVEYKKLGHEKVSVDLILDSLNIDYNRAYEVFTYILRQNPTSLEKPLSKAKRTAKDDTEITLADMAGASPDFMVEQLDGIFKFLTENEKNILLWLIEGYSIKDISIMKYGKLQGVS
jgi:DNA-directed RNA polymerase specialized sigma subunit